MTSVCRSSPVEVFLLNLLFRGFQDVFIHRQYCMNTGDGVENLQMLNTVFSHGDVDIRRSVHYFSSNIRKLIV